MEKSEIPPLSPYSETNYEKYILSGEPFTDTSFEATYSSLVSGEEIKDSRMAAPTKKMCKEKVSWKRLGEIYPEFEVYGDEVSSEDVQSGVLEQSYMLSSLKKIASDSPMALKKMFVTKDPNSAGIYVLKVYLEGEPKTIMVDDKVPYFESSKQPVFLNTGSKNIWALLLEKAWAKACGSYEKAHSLTPNDFFSFISPYPVKRLQHSRFETDQKAFFWNYVQIGFMNGYWGVVEAKESEEACEKIGLPSGHFYHLKGVFAHNDAGVQQKIVCLNGYNKTGDFKGSWAEGSSNWTDEMKKIVKYDSKHESDLFVSYDEYLEYFSTTYLNLYAPEFEMITHLPIHQPSKTHTLVKLSISSSSAVIFKLTQPFKTPNAQNGRMVIMRDVEENKEVEEKLFHIDGHFTQSERITFIESPDDLSKGIYYVWIEFDGPEIEYCLTLISSTVIQAKTVPNHEYPDFLEQMVGSYLRLKHSAYRCSKAEPDIQIKSYFGNKLGGYCAHSYINNSSNQTTYHESFKYASSAHFEYKFAHPVGQEMVEVKVSPGQQKLMITKKLHPEVDADMSYTNAFVKPDEVLQAETVERGKIRVIKGPGNADTYCKLYTYQHDCGYVFYFDNQEPENRIDALIQFAKLTNLEAEEAKVDPDTNEPSWHLVIDPGQQIYLHLRRKSFLETFGLAHRSSYKVLKPGESPRKL